MIHRQPKWSRPGTDGEAFRPRVIARILNSPIRSPESLCRGLAGPVNCATSCCTNGRSGFIRTAAMLVHTIGAGRTSRRGGCAGYVRKVPETVVIFQQTSFTGPDPGSGKVTSGGVVFLRNGLIFSGLLLFPTISAAIAAQNLKVTLLYFFIRLLS